MQLPEAGEAQLRLYNGYQCDLNVQTNLDQGNFILKQLSMYENLLVKVDNTKAYRIKILQSENKNCPAFTKDIDGTLELPDKSLKSYFISDRLIPFEDSVDKSNTGKAFVRFVSY